jgi:two-component system, sensor histidine kinase and response regulator
MSVPANVDQVPASDTLAQQTFDPAEILARVDGDTRIVMEVIEMFISDYPVILGRIRDAIASGDARKLEEHAHRLRGTIGHITVTAGYQTAGIIENLGRRHDLDGASRRIASLEMELDQLATSLERFVSDAVK